MKVSLEDVYIKRIIYEYHRTLTFVKTYEVGNAASIDPWLDKLATLSEVFSSKGNPNEEYAYPAIRSVRAFTDELTGA